MKNFSQIITEARGKHESVALLQSEITSFISKVKKNIPADVQRAIYLTGKYNIGTAEDLDEIRTATKSKLKQLVDKFNIPLADLEDLWSLMKSIKQNYKVMPQYLSASEREEIEKGLLAMDDLTIDLESKAGQNAVVKMYTPLVLRIVSQFEGRSKLDKQSLISAGMEGLALAMKDWKREPDEKTGKVTSFKTYAGYRIRQRIQNEIDANGHTLSGTNWYATAKARKGEGGGYGALDAVSFDQSEIDADHFNALAVDDTDHNDDPAWKTLFNALEKQFTQRDVDVFYRYFGVNGRKAEKSKDIAKSYGMSEGNIRNSIINKMLKFIKSKPILMDMLRDILTMYTESLMVSMFGMSKEQIIETLASNDTYILLEELTKWSTKNSFNKYYQYALGKLKDADQAEIRAAMTGGFAEIDSNLRKNGKIYIEFLRYMDPTSNNGMTDGDIINSMVNVSDYVKKYKL